MDETNEEWDLLSIIYETAHDPGFWPLALEGLKVELTDYGIQPADALVNCTSVRSNTSVDASHNRITAVRKRDAHSDLIENRAEASSHLTNFSNDKQNSMLVESQHDVSIDNMLISQHEKELIVKLTPHFNAALELNRKFVDLTETKIAANSLLDRIPFGIILVNRSGKIILENKAATKLLTNGNTLQVENGYLKTTSVHYTQSLLTLIEEVSENTLLNELDSLKTLTFKADKENPPMSILVTPYLLAGEVIADSECVALYVATTEASYKICELTLSKIFNLTKAESRLTSKIASGISIASFARNNHLSKHTIRSQLKTIYAKTKTHSQSELVKLVLTSPAIFSNVKNEGEIIRQSSSIYKRTENSLSSTSFLYLKDSRKLHYGIYGDTEGEPVILCHGSYGCYIERYPDDVLTYSLGVRLIVPDRPGYGESDVKTNRMGLDWCDDLVQLIEHLGITKVSLLGVGVGGYFAIAAAHKISKYLNKVVLVNSVAPFESIKEFSGMVPHDKIFFGLARHAPSLFKRFAELTLAGLIKNIDWYFKSLEVYGGQKDRRTISNDELVKHLKDMVCLASHHGITGFIQDMIMITKKWDFPLSSINTAVSIYHGEKQVAIPLSMGQRLENTLPKNKSYFMPNEGNYLLLNQWERIMREFV